MLLFNSIFILVSGKLPPRKIAPQLGLGFRSRLGLVLGFGNNQTITSKKNFPLVRARAWVRVSFVVGWQFSSGEFALEPFVFYNLPTLQGN